MLWERGTLVLMLRRWVFSLPFPHLLALPHLLPPSNCSPFRSPWSSTSFEVVPLPTLASSSWSRVYKTNKQGIISNILDEKVVQPLLVSTSALELATETVALILKIDDIQVSCPLPFVLFMRRKLTFIVHQVDVRGTVCIVGRT
jgi:hypothetical protein